MKTSQKTSMIWTIDKQSLQNIFDTSSTYVQILNKLSLKSTSGSTSYRRIHDRVHKDNIDLTKFKQNGRLYKSELAKNAKRKSLKNEEILCIESTVSGTYLKRRVIKDNLLPYKCSCCPIQSTHNGKPISLQLDHVNGIRNDNRLQNLRFLCPNCHSQTDNYAGKNKKSKINTRKDKCECGQCKDKYAKVCKKCHTTYNKIFNRKFNPTKQQFLQKCQELRWNYTAIGRFYGVTDNTIRKRQKKLNSTS